VDDPAPLVYPIERTVDCEPPPAYAELRRSAPVRQVRLPSGDLGYLVTRYDDVRFVLSDPAFSTDRSRPGAPQPVAMSRDDSMLGMDAPHHSRLRRLVAGAFTAHRIEELRPRIREIVDELLDRMSATERPVDLNRAVAEPLPMTVLAELLGVPVVDRDRLRDLTHRMVSLTACPPADMARARRALREHVADLVAAKRQAPSDDLLSDLIAARDRVDRLSESELVSQTLLLLVAGYETTMNQIGTSVVALLRHPGEMRRLRDDPGLTASAVEELLRHDPPGDSGQFRITVRDVEVGGTRIPANSGVLAVIPSANRDERAFDRPDRLDITRGSPHLAFGHGPHHCLGAALVRVELQTLLSALPSRFAGLALAVPVEALRWRHGLRVGGFAEVPLTW
jgi:cytochrome P450